MYIETSPGSRLNICDDCGTEMLEVYGHNYIPARGICAYTTDERSKMCPVCRDNYNAYGRRVIRRSGWEKYGISSQKETSNG